MRRSARLLTRNMDTNSPLYFRLEGGRVTYVNASKMTASGMDVTVDYPLTVGPGQLDLRLTGSYIRQLRQYPFQTAPQTYTVIDGYTTAPKYTGVLSANYTIGAWSFGWQGRFLSSTDASFVRNAPPETLDKDRTGTMIYHDLRMAYDLSERFGHSGRTYIGVQNALGKDIPALRVQDWFATGGLYDTVGPNVYAGVEWQF